MDSGGNQEGGRRAPARDTTAGDDTRDRILKVLIKYVSELSAQAAIQRADQLIRTTGATLGSANAAAYFSAVERCVIPFVDRKAQAQLHGELEFELGFALRGPLAAARLVRESLRVRSEWEATAARARAGDLVVALGGKSYDAVRTMTLVSELARNIVLYTSGGCIELRPCDSPPSLVVRADDDGPGIANLDEILSGRYRSKTGLGKGLLGAKRLANRFEIETSPRGTRIEAEVRL